MNDSLSSLPSDPDALAAHLMQSAHLGDGLPEIAAGLVYLLFSAMSWSSHLAQHHSPRAGMFALILVFVTTFAGLLAIPAIPWFRMRYLTARSGYVRRKPRHWRVSAILSTVLLVGAVFILVVLGLRGVLAQHWLLMITGILLGGLWTLFGRRRRFLVNGALIVVAGVVIGASTIPTEIAWCAFYAFAGIVTVGSGALVFRRHIRRTTEQSQ